MRDNTGDDEPRTTGKVLLMPSRIRALNPGLATAFGRLRQANDEAEALLKQNALNDTPDPARPNAKRRIAKQGPKVG